MRNCYDRILPAENSPPELEREAEMLAKAFYAQFDDDDDDLTEGDHNDAYWKYIRQHGSPRLLKYLKNSPKSNEDF